MAVSRFQSIDAVLYLGLHDYDCFRPGKLPDFANNIVSSIGCAFPVCALFLTGATHLYSPTGLSLIKLPCNQATHNVIVRRSECLVCML